MTHAQGDSPVASVVIRFIIRYQNVRGTFADRFQEFINTPRVSDEF